MPPAAPANAQTRERVGCSWWFIASLIAAGCFLAIGALPLYIGLGRWQAKCTMALSLFDVIIGSLYAALGISIGAAAIIIAAKETNFSKATKPNRCSFLIWMAWRSMLSIGVLGTLLWGTVIAFQSNLWVRMRATNAQNTICDPNLYYSSAQLIILLWLFELFCLILLGFALWCVCSGYQRYYFGYLANIAGPGFQFIVGFIENFLQPAKAKEDDSDDDGTHMLRERV